VTICGRRAPARRADVPFGHHRGSHTTAGSGRARRSYAPRVLARGRSVSACLVAPASRSLPMRYRWPSAPVATAPPSRTAGHSPVGVMIAHQGPSSRDKPTHPPSVLALRRTGDRRWSGTAPLRVRWAGGDIRRPDVGFVGFSHQEASCAGTSLLAPSWRHPAPRRWGNLGDRFHPDHDPTRPRPGTATVPPWWTVPRDALLRATTVGELHVNDRYRQTPLSR